MAQRSILVVGSSNVDMIVSVARLPAAGETVGGGRFAQVFGGKGANQAVAAARAGGRVAFLTSVGDDANGAAMLEAFACEGIDVAPARRCPGTPSGTALILVNDEGENAIAVAPGANGLLLPAHVEAAGDLLRAAAMVVLQMEIPAATVARTLALAQDAGVPVLFNYAPAGAAPELPVWEAMTGLVVNESEAGALAGMPVESVEAAAVAGRRLLERGPRWVVVTLGARGACVIDSAGVSRVPARPAKAVDTTAAGDTFCGALAAALVEGRPLADAVAFATAAAAICVTRPGAQPSIPRRAEIDALLRGEGAPGGA